MEDLSVPSISLEILGLTYPDTKVGAAIEAESKCLWPAWSQWAQTILEGWLLFHILQICMFQFQLSPLAVRIRLQYISCLVQQHECTSLRSRCEQGIWRHLSLAPRGLQYRNTRRQHQEETLCYGVKCFVYCLQKSLLCEKRCRREYYLTLQNIFDPMVLVYILGSGIRRRHHWALLKAKLWCLGLEKSIKYAKTSFSSNSEQLKQQSCENGFGVSNRHTLN